MQPTRVDSVHGYLTPKRFLSTLMNPPHKSKSNRSMAEQYNSPSNLEQSQTNLTSPPRKQRQSYKKKMSQDNALKGKEGEENIQRIQRFNTMQSKIQIKSLADSDAHENKVNDIIKMQENGQQFKDNYTNKTNKNDRKYNNKDERQENISRSEIIGLPKRNTQANIFDSRSRKLSTSSKSNAGIDQLVIQQVINRLTNMKNSLEQQILGLKNLLDDTSTTLEFMDGQFQKIKQKIITYTSRALDSAFKEYKRSLPNWAVYQAVEQNGLKKLTEFSQMIDLCKDQQKFKALGGKQTMQRKLQHYGLVVQEVKDAKIECNSQRPFISEQKIKKLQSILREIGHF